MQSNLVYRSLGKTDLFNIFTHFFLDSLKTAMGNDLTTIVPSQIIPIESYLKEFRYEKSLGSTRFLKTSLTRHYQSKEFQVAKVFIIPEELEILFQNRYEKNVKKHGKHNLSQPLSITALGKTLSENDLHHVKLHELLKYYKDLLNHYRDRLNPYTCPNLQPYSRIKIVGFGDDEFETFQNSQILSQSGATQENVVDMKEVNLQAAALPTIFNLQFVTLLRPYYSRTLYRVGLSRRAFP